MSVSVEIANRGYYPETITYNSGFGAKSLILNGGETLTVVNTTSSSNPDIPDNILNLPPDNGLYTIVIGDFRYNKNNVSIKIT